MGGNSGVQKNVFAKHTRAQKNQNTTRKKHVNILNGRKNL